MKKVVGALVLSGCLPIGVPLDDSAADGEALGVGAAFDHTSLDFSEEDPRLVAYSGCTATGEPRTVPRAREAVAGPDGEIYLAIGSGASLADDTVELPEPPESLEASHVHAVAADEGRAAVVFATLGGPGHLLSYTPASGTWSATAPGLDNWDLFALTWASDDNQLWGLAERSDEAVLLRVDPAEGVLEEVPVPNFPTWPDGWSVAEDPFQLRFNGTSLVLVAPATSQDVSLYAIGRTSGRVTALCP